MKPELKNLFKLQSNKKSKKAIIDLGSNSVRMLIYDNFKISPIPVFNEKAVCKRGKNLDKSKKLNPDGIKSSLKILLGKKCWLPHPLVTSGWENLKAGSLKVL